MTGDSPHPPAEQVAAEVRLYREARLGRLTSPTGWLSLIAKAWLPEGASRIGAASDAEIWLDTPRAPAWLGTVTRHGDEVTFAVAPGVEATARGARITSLVLRSDADGAPDEVAVGSLRLELIKRGEDLALRVRDPESPTRRAFVGVPAYDVEPRWWIDARFEPRATPLDVHLEDSDGRPQTYQSLGDAVFEVDGQTGRLQLLLESDGRRLFILFGDATNRDETYGAGRFLYAPLPAAGRVVLDFNKAFNPPCAFTSFASCPMPPAANRLPFRVPAGEKRPRP